jgi:hypothetical protein
LPNFSRAFLHNLLGFSIEKHSILTEKAHCINAVGFSIKRFGKKRGRKRVSTVGKGRLTASAAFRELS